MEAEKAHITEDIISPEEGSPAVEAVVGEPEASGWGEAPAATGWGEDPTTTVTEPVADPTPEVPPEPPTFTYEEFLARRDQARANTEIFGTVAVREVDEADFAGLTSKKNELEDFLALGSSKASKSKKGQRSTAQKTQVVVDLGFTNASLSSGGGSRGGGRGYGGRGGGRGDREQGYGGRGGGGGRFEGRGGRGGRFGGGRGRFGDHSNGQVDINDSSAFPSL